MSVRNGLALGLAAAVGCLAVVLLISSGQPGSDRSSAESATLAASPLASTRCPSVPLTSVLTSSDLVVSGTVVDVRDQAVVVQIDHVYRGNPELQTVRIRRGPGVAASFRASSVWAHGRRQLVTAKNGAVIECVGGATGPWSQERADEYQRALS